MRKSIKRLLVGILFLWQSLFVSVNFLRLCLQEGELKLVEPVVWVRWLELGLNIIILLIAMTAVIWFFHDFIKEIR